MNILAVFVCATLGSLCSLGIALCLYLFLAPPRPKPTPPPVPPPRPRKLTRVLCIGDAMLMDATLYLQNIAVAQDKTMAVTTFMAQSDDAMKSHQRAVASDDSDPDHVVKTQTGPQARLFDHLTGQAAAWDVVVLQQSQGKDACLEEFTRSASELARLARKHSPGARILIYDSWSAAPGFYGANPCASDVCRAVAANIGAEYLPVGRALAFAGLVWQKSVVSVAARYVAALTIYQSIYGLPVVGCSFHPGVVSPGDALEYQLSAHRAHFHANALVAEIREWVEALAG